MAIGLFEVDGGCSTAPYYEITSPLFDRVTLKLNPDYYPGDKFEIITRNNSDKNLYIRKATFNGKPWSDCTIPHSDFVKGGTLILDMSSKPNKSWGAHTFDK
jgi:putative alpha-1,2-mannosidase